MSLVKLRRAAQLTLPADVRRALKVKEGDYLEAEVVSGGVMLKPVSVVDRERAWERLMKAVSEVKDREATADEDNVAEEKAIAVEVKASRAKHA